MAGLRGLGNPFLFFQRSSKLLIVFSNINSECSRFVKETLKIVSFFDGFSVCVTMWHGNHSSDDNLIIISDPVNVIVFEF